MSEVKFNFGQGGGQQQQQGGGFGGQQGGQRRGGGGGRQQQHQQQQQGGGGRGNTQVYEYSADIQFLNTKKFEEKVKRGDGMWLIQFFSSSGMLFIFIIVYLLLFFVYAKYCD